MKRLYSLDYLRGITALGIMFYHITMWEFGQMSSDAFLARIGIFGVAVFYMLSGLTLFYVYEARMQPNKTEIIDFFLKRFLRLFPLLWLVTFLSIWLSKKTINYTDLFLNLTGLFGIFRWDAYYATGTWSIGNELSFYLLFPLVIYLLKNNKPGFWIFYILTIGLFLYFTFEIFDTHKILGLQWKNYVNPLNQAFLFFSGITLGVVFQEITISKILLSGFFILSLAVFILYPVHGNSIRLVYGLARIILTFSTFLMCLSTYKSNLLLPKTLHVPLVFLGDISYSIYLLHPIVYTLLGKIMVNVKLDYPPHFRFVITVISTLILSHFIYEYYEKFFVRLGKFIKKTSPMEATVKSSS